ncbi:sirohydrochlorin chelatase [Microlunatus panaciterrae]|uniref:Sirohydrochlorin ferrochelatase n=1 Tax=Microlunatus panaciterrae TaxID=400768 RepID=A0ABS2RMT7_9ACTN|nr:sirohydrochlorin chelatase [Microlunatus panaciterrae]MBM7799501.1 sirohydrochlorin ferrochelatase [Microlunatus panaciterrae]
MSRPQQRAAHLSLPPLIGLAHGSRHPGVRQSLATLMSAAGALPPQPPTRPAFLDLTEPDLTTVACSLAEAGYGRAVVVPLLFTEAFHSRVDVPESVRRASEVSGLRIVTANVLGTGEEVLQVLQAGTEQLRIGSEQTIMLFSVGSSDDEANDAVVDLAARWQQRRGSPVVPAFGTREPRGRDVLASLAGPVTVVPLFVSPGLLLDALIQKTDRPDIRVAPPLEARLAPLVVQRYLESLR